MCLDVACISKASQKLLINDYKFHREIKIEFTTSVGSYNETKRAMNISEELSLMKQNNLFEFRMKRTRTSRWVSDRDDVGGGN